MMTSGSIGFIREDSTSDGWATMTTSTTGGSDRYRYIDYAVAQGVFSNTILDPVSTESSKREHKVNVLKQKMIDFYSNQFVNIGFDDIKPDMIAMKKWFLLYVSNKKLDKKREVKLYQTILKSFDSEYRKYKKAKNRKVKAVCRDEILKLFDFTTRLPSGIFIKEVKKRVVEIKKKIKILETEISCNTNFYETILSLTGNRLIESFGHAKNDEFGFYFITKPLELVYTNTKFVESNGKLGRFLIRLSCYGGRHDIKIINLTRKHITGGHEHFCIIENVCWGENGEYISKILDSGNLNTLIISIISFLETPAYKSPYMNPIERWFNEASTIHYTKLSDIIKINRIVKKDIITFYNGGERPTSTNSGQYVEMIQGSRDLIGSTITSEGRVYREIFYEQYRVVLREGPEMFNHTLQSIFSNIINIEAPRRFSRLREFATPDSEHLRVVDYFISVIESIVRQISNFYPDTDYTFVFSEIHHSFSDWASRGYQYITFGNLDQIGLTTDAYVIISMIPRDEFISMFGHQLGRLGRQFINRQQMNTSPATFHPMYDQQLHGRLRGVTTN